MPTVMQTELWGKGQIEAALNRGPHKSSHNGIKFIREEYSDMMDKQQWTMLPVQLVCNKPGLRLSPLGLVPKRGHHDRMICNGSMMKWPLQVH